MEENMKFIGMGDNVVDRYINKKIMFPGGNCVNFAVFAKKIGFESAYLGLIADDKEGRLVRDSLIKLGVDVSKSPLVPGGATERCDVTLIEGDRVFVGCNYGKGEHKTLKLTSEHLEYLKEFSVIHCGCYAEMEDEMHLLKGIDAIKTFDFSVEEEYRVEAYLEKVCPYIDMALFSGEKMDSKEIILLKDKVMSLGTKYVLITRGIEGQTLYDGTGEYKGIVKPVTPVDTMGAGDSFFTAFIATLVGKGWRKGQALYNEIIEKAFEFAASYSAENCKQEGSYGFATPYEDE